MLTNSLLFSHILEELPYVFVQAVTYGVIVYAMPGFDWTVEKFFWYLFFMYFTLLYFTFYGMMAVGVKPNHHVVSIVAAVFYAIWNLFSGFIVVRPVSCCATIRCMISMDVYLFMFIVLFHFQHSIPFWWRWYYWACPVAWTLYGLVASQFGDTIQTKSTEDNKLVIDFIEDYFGINITKKKKSFNNVIPMSIIPKPLEKMPKLTVRYIYRIFYIFF